MITFTAHWILLALVASLVGLAISGAWFSARQTSSTPNSADPWFSALAVFSGVWFIPAVSSVLVQGVIVLI